MDTGEESRIRLSSKKVKYAIVAVLVVVVLLCSSALYMYYYRANLQIVDGANGHLFSLSEPDVWAEITVKNTGRRAGTGILYATLEVNWAWPEVYQEGRIVCGGSTYVSLGAGQQEEFVVRLHIPESYYDLDLLNNHTLFGDFNCYLVTP